MDNKKKVLAYEEWVLEQLQSNTADLVKSVNGIEPDEAGNVAISVESSAIIDVIELPTENINENVFYRLLTADLVGFGSSVSIVHCRIVDNLPEIGVYSDPNIRKIIYYYNLSDGNTYIYADEKAVSNTNLTSVGWYSIEQFYQINGTYSWGGIITNINEAYNDKVTHHLLLTYTILSYKDGKWITNEVIGRKGNGIDSVIFNHPKNKANGNYSHAEGQGTKATGDVSHAEGYETHSEAYGSHAEGCQTYAQGNYSHTEGYLTYTKDWYTHAEGQGTVANCKNQHVQGQYNIVDPKYVKDNNSKIGQYAHIVGNGTSEETRSNAHTLDWNGLGWFAGGLKIGGTGQDDETAVEVALKTDIEGLATETYVADQVAALVNSAPDKLNTLDELAAALGDDENFAATVTTQIADKIGKSELDSTIETALSDLINNYSLNIDYDKSLAFDTSEIVINTGNNTSSILDQAMLGQLILA
jgi:hypothetical protein